MSQCKMYHLPGHGLRNCCVLVNASSPIKKYLDGKPLSTSSHLCSLEDCQAIMSFVLPLWFAVAVINRPSTSHPARTIIANLLFKICYPFVHEPSCYKGIKFGLLNYQEQVHTHPKYHQNGHRNLLIALPAYQDHSGGKPNKKASSMASMTGQRTPLSLKKVEWATPQAKHKSKWDPPANHRNVTASLVLGEIE